MDPNEYRYEPHQQPGGVGQQLNGHPVAIVVLSVAEKMHRRRPTSWFVVSGLWFSTTVETGKRKP
jgi:hypothetical protein